MPREQISDSTLLETLKSQHNVLRDNLATVNNIHENSKKILKSLETFSSNLKSHLALENKTFYPRTKEKMKDSPNALKSIGIFIDEMMRIEKDVVAFLTSYNTETSISNNLEKFRQDLNSMTSIIVLRLESEEDGVFLYLSY